MATKNKLLQAAAGAASGGGATTVGVEFNGSGDRLTRTSDLTGNTDSKTFTFSAWVFHTDSSSDSIYTINKSSDTFNIATSSSAIFIGAKNSSGTSILNATLGNYNQKYPRDTWFHLLVSIDMSNSSYRQVYINDEAVSSATWNTYTNDFINFTDVNHVIGGTNNFRGRLAGVYLDHTWRDLSNPTNRRLFIDENKQYVAPPTTGILNVPMDDVDDLGKNDGTGGDFTPSTSNLVHPEATPATYQSSATPFLGSRYLSRTGSLTGISDGKQFTFSFWFKSQDGNTATIFSSDRDVLRLRTQNNEVSLVLQNSAENSIYSMTTSYTFIDKLWYCVNISGDLTDTSKRHVYINGVAQSPTYSTYTNDTIDFTRNDYEIARNDNSVSENLNGELSDFYFDTTYIDLSASNPFYDSDTGKPKALGLDGSVPTGSSPILYFPMSADNPAANYGSSDDFDEFGGGFTGTRGPSDTWVNTLRVGTSSNRYVYNASSWSNTRAVSGATFFNSSSDSGDRTIFRLRDEDNSRFIAKIFLTSGARVEGDIYNQSGTSILQYRDSANDINTNTWYVLLWNADFAASSGFLNVYEVGEGTYLQNIEPSGSFTGSPSASDNIGTSGVAWSQMSFRQDPGNLDLGPTFIWDSKIDFNDRAIASLFVDIDHFPTSSAKIQQAIDDSVIAEPLIWAKWELGSTTTNSGSLGGTFTLSGSAASKGFVGGDNS
jgi:hypothetical protein